jgi:poly-gamma-glutamate synthesis protein (capsule biosynthesis protein)
MKPDPDPSLIHLIALGDIMLGGRVARAIGENGAAPFFDRIRPFLEPSALIFGNLEMPFSTDEPSYLGGVHPSYRSPPGCIEAAEALRLKVVNLATNHVLDWGPQAIERTRSLLLERGIQTVGAGLDERQARRPAIIRSGDRRCGFLGYCKRGEYTARGPRPGAALLEPDGILADIAALRERVDVLTVSLHWGLELSDHPDPGDVELARRLIDAGADLILGHHPHVLQGIERRHHGLIAYSLGNFIFDNRAGHIVSLQAWDERHQGMILDIQFSEEGIAGHRIIPTQLTGELAVVPAGGTVREEILGRLERLSAIITGDRTGEYFYRDGVEKILKRELLVYWTLLRQEGPSCLLRGLRNFKWRYVRLICKFLWTRITAAR